MYPYFMDQQPVNGAYPNGNYNPYLSRLNAMQQPQAQPMQITRVNGRNGADAFQMPPNSTILLLDETQPVVWLAQTDGAGYKTCTPYKIAPYQPEPEPDFHSLDERITRLEMALNGESDHAADATRNSATDTNVSTK